MSSAPCCFATLSGETSDKPSDVEFVPTSEVRKLEPDREMVAEDISYITCVPY